MSKTVLTFGKEKRSRSKTQQHFRESVNINQIMKKAQKTGVLPIRSTQPYFGDFSQVTDYKESLDKIKNIDNLFMKLPSDVRNRFKNDPANILDFINDPANDAEIREMGLKEPYTQEERNQMGAEQEAINAAKKAEGEKAADAPTS